jgi:hypothetical protein
MQDGNHKILFLPFYTIDILASIMVVCKIDPKFIPLYTDKTSTFATINKWNLITVRFMHNDHWYEVVCSISNANNHHNTEIISCFFWPGSISFKFCLKEISLNSVGQVCTFWKENIYILIAWKMSQKYSKKLCKYYRGWHKSLSSTFLDMCLSSHARSISRGIYSHTS